MNAIELLDIISAGETSKVQFKQEMDDDKFAAEMIAMSNAKGGVILVGVEDKTGQITGLNYEQLQSYNSRLANIANDKVKPQIFISTEVVSITSETDENKILVVYLNEGTNKPYKDNSGTIWLKQGADKRKLVDNNEILRLFQQSGRLYIDEMIVPETSVDDVSFAEVRKYIKVLQKSETDDEIDINKTLLTNLNIMKDNRLTLGGLLFFSHDPQKYRPAFCIKAISFFGNSIGSNEYRSSKDIVGTIPEMFEQAIDFFTANLHSVQAGQNFNSVGKLEVSQTALEELLQNALVHRDYSKNAPIRIMIFDNRIEIVSPGALPNSLTIENIKLGNAVVRNNLMVSYCSKLMNYRGFGSGITRALKNQPNIELINDTEGEQFIVKIPRPAKGEENAN
jgi:predicted HTH transcriptional regulator